VKLWEHLPAPELRRALLRLGPARLRRLDAIAAMSPSNRFVELKGVLAHERRAQLFEPSTGPDRVAALLEELFSGAGTEPLGQILHVDARLGLVDDMLHYFDRMSMAHSLEVRVPFLDHRLVEFAASVPPSLKVRRLTTKWIVKESARGLIPDSIIDKAKVGFFNASVEGWMERALHGSVRETLTDPSCRYGDYMDATVIRKLAFADSAQRSRADRHLLLAVTMFEHWLGNVFAQVSTERDSFRAVGPRV
jgi:asparagine synthase (glutamine-hydrolysing)